MIPRYSRPEMAAIWTDDAKLQRWLDVELAVCRAWARRGVIPAEDLHEIETKAAFDVERTLEIEKTTNHDVVAFLTNVNENIGPASRWVHYGMTSSDVLDTGLALAMVQSGKIIVEGQRALTQALKRRALEHRDTLCVGRTHGVHAEPTTFGLRLAAIEGYLPIEQIKIGRDDGTEIAQMKTLMGNMRQAGIKLLCYNFMAGTDWVRTRLDAQLCRHLFQVL